MPTNPADFIPLRRKQPAKPKPAHHHNIYDQIRHDWYIPPDDRHKLSNYYILHWTPEYLFSTWGTKPPITRESITYLRIYYRCSLAELRACQTILLSFRKLPDMPTGYVLITPAKSGTHQWIDPKSAKSMVTRDKS